MTDCRQQTFHFQDNIQRKVQIDFSGGYLSSDAGGIILRELESKKGLIKGLSRCFDDVRNQSFVEHSVEELLSQRIMGLALGYEDLNDHDRLRLDPLLALLCGKKDILGHDRVQERDYGKALAAHSTLNRLELSSAKGLSYYHKIFADENAIEKYLLESGVKMISRRVREIVLDFDATDDLIHGDQEGRFYHGYYNNYCYLPLYCFCGNIPLWAQLRPSNIDASEGTVEALEKIVKVIRKRFGRKVRIIVRADSGFCREKIMSWCEGQKKVYYCIGLSKNVRLKQELEPALERMRQVYKESGSEESQREFIDFNYRTLKSWSCPRRVIGKAEVLSKGDNPRFIVTNLPEKGFKDEGNKERFNPQNCYEKFYCARGNMENRIKEQQLELFADRTSTAFLKSNQLRLWFSTFAYMLVESLRAEVLKGSDLAKATVGSIRIKLFKIAGSIKVSCRRIYIQLSSAHPGQELFAMAVNRLQQIE